MNYVCNKYPNHYGRLFVSDDKKAAVYYENNNEGREKLFILFDVVDEDILIPVKCNYIYKNEVIISNYREYAEIYGPFNICLPARNLILDYFGDTATIIT